MRSCDVLGAFKIGRIKKINNFKSDNNKKMGSRDWNVDFWKGQTYNLGEERLASYLTNLN